MHNLCLTFLVPRCAYFWTLPHQSSCCELAGLFSISTLLAKPYVAAVYTTTLFQETTSQSTVHPPLHQPTKRLPRQPCSVVFEEKQTEYSNLGGGSWGSLSSTHYFLGSIKGLHHLSPFMVFITDSNLLARIDNHGAQLVKLWLKCLRCMCHLDIPNYPTSFPGCSRF